ncbi:unnamed protein product [Acanthoscelides obtectus]|uniref:Uncharacterized protein n=1 Tax=Acanthoscelides obtectus TaxID=200917 RepID=A0A9P0NWQ6_ACAOB|nr:unnamed protein product [Acanthoscelides obtectus]CAK1634640.1 hypothetical protein AOBTE_LOCUS8843 [Acanthoscelides obtectus]
MTLDMSFVKYHDRLSMSICFRLSSKNYHGARSKGKEREKGGEGQVQEPHERSPHQKIMPEHLCWRIR